MKILSTLLFAFALTHLWAQDTTNWETIDTIPPRFSSDSILWHNTSVFETNDHSGIQYRYSNTGLVQRREIWYKRD